VVPRSSGAQETHGPASLIDHDFGRAVNLAAVSALIIVYGPALFERGVKVPVGEEITR